MIPVRGGRWLRVLLDPVLLDAVVGRLLLLHGDRGIVRILIFCA
jgi:hypothetical protein